MSIPTSTARMAMFFVGILVLAEVACSTFWIFYGRQRLVEHLFVDMPTAVRNSDAGVADSKTHDFDSLLGWVNKPGNPGLSNWGEIGQQGARRSSYRSNWHAVHAYGDSFVFGADVESDETFPHYLSQLINSEVRNFGVGGYGPDQALMLLERHLRSGLAPPVVILGMPSENIARVVNVIWKRYIPLVSPFVIKPIFHRDGGGDWRLVRTVPDDLTDKPSVLQSLLDSRQYDFWYRHNRLRPKIKFPYSWSTLMAIRYLTFDVIRWQDLYQDDDAVAALEYVLTRFASLAEQYNFRPVFLIIPMPQDLMRKERRLSPHYEKFIDRIRKKLTDLTVVDVLDQQFEHKRFNVKPYSGHASGYGNQIIANSLYAAVKPLITGRLTPPLKP